MGFLAHALVGGNREGFSISQILKGQIYVGNRTSGRVQQPGPRSRIKFAINLSRGS
jgi:hypothetical protein